MGMGGEKRGSGSPNKAETLPKIEQPAPRFGSLRPGSSNLGTRNAVALRLPCHKTHRSESLWITLLAGNNEMLRIVSGRFGSLATQKRGARGIDPRVLFGVIIGRRPGGTERGPSR